MCAPPGNGMGGKFANISKPCADTNNGEHLLCDTNDVTPANICSQIPFASICVDIDSPDSNDYETARQRTFKYCRRNLSDPKCYGIEPELEDEAKKPNSATWVDSQFTSENPTGIISTPYTGGKKGNQFLQGRAGDLNKGDLIVNDSDRGDLNLETATYKDVPLDGDDTNGVAFFAGKISSEDAINTNPLYYYAGLFSGTDLGAPVSGADGATASWVGSLAATNLDQNKDIVLTITFRSGGGDIDAFVETAEVKDFLIDGHFNAHGVIGGRVAYKEFAANERTIANASEANGDLTGLIGVKGAIGAFISDDTGPTGYAGGFVARPVLELTGVLNKVCGDGINYSVTNGDPFHPFCDSEIDKQRKRVEICSEGNNANHPGCAGALAVHGCIADPFAANCKSDSAFATARQNRINFCNGSGVEDALCKTDKLANICDYAPFSPICSKHAGSAGRRTEVAFNECRNNGTGVDDCHGIAPALADGDKRPNTATWADSFVTFADYNGLGDKPDIPGKSQFLKGSPDGFQSEGIYIYSQNFYKNLNLSNARFANINLGGFYGDGVGYFWGRHNNVYSGYARISSGTDLGAPVSEVSGTTASWVGQIQAFGKTLNGGRRGVNKGFVLEVTFGNDDADKAGSIAAFVRTEGNFNYLLSGTFDNHGVISGTTTWANFINRDRNATTGEKNLGTLTGLIGQEGAVGGFHSNYSGEKSYGGGFVARPVDAVRNAQGTAQAALNTACNTNPFEDPNRELCYLEYAKARVATIDDCLNDDGTVKTSSKCTIAADHNSCINNPFAIGCDTDSDFKDFHVKARENRIEFCNREGSQDSSLCMPTEVVTAICDDYLFGTGCLSHSNYNEKRLVRADFCTTNMSHPDCEEHGVTPANICSQIPFYSDCVGYDDERLELAKICANDDNTNPKCDDDYVSTADICTRIPFASTCDGDIRFNPYRETHITSCNNGGSEAEGLDCTSTKVVAAICENNLFGTVCLRHTNYDPNRADCNTEGGKNAPACRTPGAIVAICTNNLFGVGCLTHPRYDTDRDARIDFCNMEVNLRKSKCMPAEVVAAVCEDNLFGTGCVKGLDPDGVYADKRTARISLCNKETTPASDPECSPIDVVNAVCENNLFGNGCVRSVGYNTRLGKRISFCNIETNLEHDDCTPTKVVDAVCTANFFGTGCVNSLDSDGVYAGKRKERLDFCSINSKNELCIDANLDNICSYAPFSPPCLNHTISSHKRSDSKFTACRATGPEVLTCHGVRKEPSNLTPNVAAWVNDFVTIDNPNGLSSVMDTGKTNQFLEGNETGLDQAGVNVYEAGVLHISDVLDSNTDTSDALPNIQPVPGSGGGVAFFYGYNSSGDNPGHRFAAGILSGTDLGAPITGTNNTSAVWHGKFQSVFYTTETFFDLQINFINNGTGTIKALIERSGASSSYLPHYYLDGDFDANGLIEGEVIAGTFENKDTSPTLTPNTLAYHGILRGLIGEDGAVGAFVGGASTDNGVTFDTPGYFAGGFVAYPFTVNYDAWAGVATPLDAIGTITGNQFLSGKLLDSTTTSTVLNLQNAKYNGYRLNGDRADGVAFFKNQPTTGQTSYYAGVLSDTDLGEPVAQTGKSAYWSGSLQVANLHGIASAVDFVLTVNFVDTADKAGNIKAGSIKAVALNAAEDNGPRALHLDGTFNHKGVIRGTSNLGNFSYASGKLIGLIGQDGAVGTFISTGGVVYSGGFVARPHSVKVKDLRNYATLRTTPNAITDAGGFLRAVTNGVVDHEDHFPSDEFEPIQDSFTDGRRDGDNNDGYQYFGIENDDGDTRYYAGILKTTNLGAPLAAPIGDAPTFAIWEGHVSFNTIAKKVSTNFYVNFSDGIIGFANTAGNGTGKASIEVANSPSGVQLTLNGKFGAGATDANGTLGLGQLGGDMRVSTINKGDTPLPVMGLIGQDGVVGVFVNPSATLGSAGGFVGQPRQ